MNLIAASSEELIPLKAGQALKIVFGLPAGSLGGLK
jgi:hypothetical protein